MTQSAVAKDMQKAAAGDAQQGYRDPTVLLSILKTEQVRLVKPAFLIDWFENESRPLPCRQHLPEDAFVNVSALIEEAQAQLVIIVLSYTWLTKAHPDPERWHLETIVALLKLFCRSSFQNSAGVYGVGKHGLLYKAECQKRGMRFGAGDGQPVGVFIDWTALHQDKPPEVVRSPEEEVVFKSALKGINTWYGHKATVVWMLTCMPSSAQRPGYHESGWTTFEACVAGILTRETDMLDISAEVRARVLKGEYKDYLNLALKAICRTNRVPVTYESFCNIIADKTFTNGADRDAIVLPKYKRTFDDIVPSLLSLDFANVDLTTAQAEQLLELIGSHTPGLRCLDLAGNGEIDLPLHAFCAPPTLTVLRLRGCDKIAGDVASLRALPCLEVADLDHVGDNGITGDLGAFSALVRLTELNLQSTKVVGDVAALEPLVQLTMLNLSATQLVGDIGAFTPLVRLTHLELGAVKVAGDVAALAPLVLLEKLYLALTLVSGDVACLGHLVRLESLSLERTAVSGDVGGLGRLVCLTSLVLKGTAVSGDISALEPLVHIQRLTLEGSQVTGDVEAFCKARKKRA